MPPSRSGEPHPPPRSVAIAVRRKIGYSAATILLFVLLVGAVNAGLKEAEKRGWLATHRQDSLVSYVESELFVLDGSGENYIVSTYGGRSMSSSTVVPVRKRGAWRLGTTGGSLVRGEPYSDPRSGAEQPGTMQFWLRTRLVEAWDGAEFQVINAGCSGGDSARLVDVVPMLLQLDIDVLFLAAGNNEGTPTPPQVQSFLHKQPAYRLALQASA